MSTITQEYTHLKIKGSLGVVPITPEDIEGKSLDVYILMGGSGSGKSSFIELLSPDQKLEISGDSLESVTQEVVCYQIVNMTVGKGQWTVVLMDTPGFRDPRMSESRIMAKIMDALDSLRKSASRVAVYIFYFHPITDIRIAGTKRDSVKLLKSFAESFEASGITVITTLWDRISTANGQRVEDAHGRLRSLADEIFVQSDELRITVTKCDYSKDSALSILDTAHGGWLHEREMPQTRDLKYQSLIRNNLVDRINNAQQHLQILADDKRNATTIGREDPILLQSVHKEERQVLDALESFANDLRILDPTVYRSVFPDPDVPIPRHPLPHSSPLPETRPQHLATSDDPIRTTAQTYKSLKINGPLSVVPVTPEDVKGEILFVDILMGPTGSGKSTFIESLSPEQKLDISGDSLESVTQHVTCYQVVNLGHQLYNTCYILMDTPGFLDPRLPESRIMTMITQKLDDLRHSATMVFVSMLYFQPITDIRFGLKRHALKLLRAAAGSLEDTAVTVVTTMWNHTSHPKRMEDASRRFSTLSDEIFQRSDRRPIKVTKFEFSTDSALLILDGVHGRCHHIEDTSQNMDPQYQSLILNNLLKRISNTHERLLALAEDKQNTTTPGREDPLLLEVVLRDEKVALGALQSSLDDLYEIDPGSCSSPFLQENVPQSPPPTSSLSPPSPPLLSSSPSPSNKKSMSAHLKGVTSHLKKIFKKP